MGRNEFFLDLDIGIVEGAASQALEGANGILEIGDFLGFSALTEVSALRSEANEGSVTC